MSNSVMQVPPSAGVDVQRAPRPITAPASARRAPDRRLYHPQQSGAAMSAGTKVRTKGRSAAVVDLVEDGLEAIAHEPSVAELERQLARGRSLYSATR